MRLFVAGATGATGRVFVPLATEAGHSLVLHVRPQSAGRLPDPRARVFDLADADALLEAVRGSDAVLSFVGTMRSRFATGDTYESSDIASTQQLAAAAKAAGVPRFLLLSSAGAGGSGAYLKMKGECERIVRDSGLGWDVFRPSALVSPEGGEASHHGRREVPFGVEAVGAWASRVPGLRGVADDWRPMPLTVLSRAFLAALAKPPRNAVWAGRDIWAESR